ncbi:LuxR family transcriptional regulator [Kitasatospora herbaricolor]|uniref:helix-turn-helix transcriptional regulator n=1 Tax=Kitasatospora herbaricolor TaxID=68217 RepID=UPI00174D353F|nr:LuxR C-terminal-related transcriptional regulator [Kitasatospora herbaricolor]MDQ0311377.1 DNA-binding CsgD family transcriptional regulator [Kitasatospora herbaricolor]GGV22740.1 LuxR family transcriptional regulator [Kitasatospora herbaricolor]
MTSFPTLSEQDLRVFQWAAGHGRLAPQAAAELGLSEAEVQRSAQVLERLHLLRRLPGGPDGERGLVAVPPELAAASLLAPAEAELRRQLADAERVRAELALLTPLYAPAGAVRKAEPLDEIVDLNTVIDVISTLTARCRTEVLTCQPGGPRAPHLLEQAFARDLEMIRRGVRMRTLYQHTSRRHAPTQEYVRRISAAGAEVRTLTALFGRMIAFDRETAIIPHHDAYDGAVVIRDQSTVAYLVAVFDHSWTLADPYAPATQAQADSSLDEIKQAIVRLLAEGMKDEMIARRLGMSLRTCRKHIAESMETLGASSRFQAGYLARARGELAEPG